MENKTKLEAGHDSDIETGLIPQNENSFKKMKVTIEATPNPESLKFLLSMDILDNETIEFPNVERAELSPLAMKLFGFPWTNNIVFGDNFITLTKQSWIEWDFVKEPLAQIIEDHFRNGEALFSEYTLSEEEIENDIHQGISRPEDSLIVQQIKTFLQKEIRPILVKDGGDIKFVAYEGDILYVKLLGACAGCPNKVQTLKEGIEVYMKEIFPSLKEVVSVESNSCGCHD